MKIDPINSTILRIDSALTEDQLKILTQQVYTFLLAGGVVSWSEWAQLDENTKKAFLLAGDELRRHSAGLIGLASLGPREAQAVREGWSEEDYKAQAALDTAEKQS